MLHPSTELRFVNQTVGNGVFATEPIPKGTIVWVRDPLDREFRPDDFYALPHLVVEKLLTYSYRNHKGNYIFCWDNAKFVNHSFLPNCMTTPYGFEIAVRHIGCGEQLTNDYGTLNIIEPFTPEDEGHARKTVLPNDIETYYREWDCVINDALPHLPLVRQPLLELLNDETRKWIDRLAIDSTARKSILECLHQEG